MNFSEIFQIKLIKSDFVKLPNKDHFKLTYVDQTNYDKYINDVNTVISLIYTDLPNWDNPPNFNNVVKRFNADSHCLLFYYNNKCIGWNWANKNVSFNWIDIDQKLGPDEVYSGGTFVSKHVDRPRDAGLYNYNMMCDFCLNYQCYSAIYGYVDIWNKASIRLSLQTGVKFCNFLNKNSN